MKARSNLGHAAGGIARGRSPLSSGVRAGQRRSAAGLLALLSAALPLAAQAAPKETPSGLPVPRYVATRFDEVNARGGPGDDYKLKWTYHARGLPLQVVEETADWRRVCDPDGGLAWVHRRTVAADRRVMNIAASDLPLHDRPNGDARIVTRLAARATASLVDCKTGWCRLKAGRTSGWVEAARLWGLSDTRQCR